MDELVFGSKSDSVDADHLSDAASTAGSTIDQKATITDDHLAASIEASSSCLEAGEEEETAVDVASLAEACDSGQELNDTASESASAATGAGGVRSSCAPEDAMAIGNDLEVAIQEIMALGYSRGEATVAMETNCNNPDRAVEYLLKGTSHVISVPKANDGDASRFPAAAEGVASESDDPLIVFASHPHFSEIRQMLNASPQHLNSFLQQVRRTNPRLHQAICDNRERFRQTLNDPIAADIGVQDFGGGVSNASSSLILSHHEYMVVEKLMALGFPESLCVQAYFACEKNEELAADFLLTQDDNDLS